MKNLPAFHSDKLAFGPAVLKAMQNGLGPIQLGDPLKKTLPDVAEALGSGEGELIAQMSHEELNRGFRAKDQAVGESAVFGATGNSDSTLLPGMKSRAGRLQKTQKRLSLAAKIKVYREAYLNLNCSL